MRQTKPGTLVGWGGIGLVGAFGFCYLWESYGQALPQVPWPAIIGMLLLSGALMVLGWPIKKWNEGDRKQAIDPLKAARVAMMAKAAALAGALLTGWYGGTALYLTVSADGLRGQSAVGMLAAVATAALLMIVGMIVESYCQLPPDDPSEQNMSGADPA